MANQNIISELQAHISHIVSVLEEFDGEVVEKEFEIKMGFKFDVDLDKESNMKVIEQALLEYGKEKLPEVAKVIQSLLKAKLDEAISSSWGWIEGSRDIIDTGELRNSLSLTLSDSTVNISYDSEHAAVVHNGGYIQPYGNPNADSVYLPARPWIAAVLGQAPGPVQPLTSDEISSKLDGTL